MEVCACGQRTGTKYFGSLDGTHLGCGKNDPDWVTGTVYTTSSIITPLTGNTGVLNIGYSFQRAGNCTSGASEPSPWTQTLGATT